MPGTRLRLLPARPTHAAAVAHLVRIGTPEQQHARWDAARLGRRIRSPNSALVLAAAGRYLAGAAVLDLLSEQAQLSLLVVHPHYRRIGIGSALLGWVETTASTAGLFTLQLKLEASNGAGRAFCFAHHFRERGRLPAFYADGTAAVRLVRDLRVNSEPA
jgi:ribosomal-protein-alanine N-acetyltransferase